MDWVFGIFPTRIHSQFEMFIVEGHARRVPPYDFGPSVYVHTYIYICMGVCVLVYVVLLIPMDFIFIAEFTNEVETFKSSLYFLHRWSVHSK